MSKRPFQAKQKQVTANNGDVVHKSFRRLQDKDAAIVASSEASKRGPGCRPNHVSGDEYEPDETNMSYH